MKADAWSMIQDRLDRLEEEVRELRIQAYADRRINELQHGFFKGTIEPLCSQALRDRK